MDTTRTSGPFELHAPGAFSPTVGDWVITSAKSPDPGTRARYTVVGTVPAHAEGTHGWEYPTDEELHAIALMFKAAPALLVASIWALGRLQIMYRDMGQAEKAPVELALEAAIALAEKD